jgi:hypothetical protein
MSKTEEKTSKRKSKDATVTETAAEPKSEKKVKSDKKEKRDKKEKKSKKSADVVTTEAVDPESAAPTIEATEDVEMKSADPTVTAETPAAEDTSSRKRSPSKTYSRSTRMRRRRCPRPRPVRHVKKPNGSARPGTPPTTTGIRPRGKRTARRTGNVR